MPLDFGRPEKPVGPASHTVDLGALSVTVDAAGQLAVARRGRSLLCADVLLPWLSPGPRPQSPAAEDGNAGAAPRLAGGKLTKEDVAAGRHFFRLTGTLACPPPGEGELQYEARFHLGAEPLLAIDYVRLRSPGPALRLAHWEHRVAVDKVDALLLAGEDEPRPAPVRELVLETGAGVPALALRSGRGWVVADSADVSFYGQGALTLHSVPGAEGLHRLGLHRLTPGRPPHVDGECIDLDAGAALSFSFTLDLRDSLPDSGVPAAARCASPLRRQRPDEVLLLRGAAADDELGRRLRDRVSVFTIPCGPLAGLHYGHYDHLNRRFIKAPATRAEAGAYVLNEYLRSGDTWWLDRALRFGRAHLDLRSSAAPGAGAPPGDPVDSCRAAHLFLHLHALTGDPAYLAAAQADGEYVARRAGRAQPHQAGLCGGLAALWYHTGGGQFGSAAREMAAGVAALQGGDGSWHERYRQDGSPDGCRSGDEAGPAEPGPVRPGVASRAVVGLLDMAEILACAEGVEAARRALDWLLSVQRPEGTWGWPDVGGRGLAGGGALEHSLALLLGYRRFEDEAYLEAAVRALDWAQETWDRRGYLPVVIGLWPDECSEASAGYFCGLEAAALHRELAQ